MRFAHILVKPFAYFSILTFTLFDFLHRLEEKGDSSSLNITADGSVDNDNLRKQLEVRAKNRRLVNGRFMPQIKERTYILLHYILF